MSFLSQVTTGRANEGQKIVIYGREGVGKTTLACQAPNSLLIPCESGYKVVDTPRLKKPLENWAEVESLSRELIAEAKCGQIPKGSTFVWDTATALERFIHTEVLKRDTKEHDPKNTKKLGKMHSMETAHEGFGKAYTIANSLFAEFLDWQEQLAVYGGMNIVITCHRAVYRVSDPTAGEYDAFELQLHSPKNGKNYGKREHLVQWADLVGFLHKPLIVTKNANEKSARGVETGEGRILEIEGEPAWTAKNRYRITQPIRVPLTDGWNHLAGAIYQGCGIDIYNRALVPTQQGVKV